MFPLFFMIIIIYFTLFTEQNPGVNLNVLLRNTESPAYWSWIDYLASHGASTTTAVEHSSTSTCNRMCLRSARSHMWTIEMRDSYAYFVVCCVLNESVHLFSSVLCWMSCWVSSHHLLWFNRVRFQLMVVEMFSLKLMGFIGVIQFKVFIRRRGGEFKLSQNVGTILLTRYGGKTIKSLKELAGPYPIPSQQWKSLSRLVW